MPINPMSLKKKKSNNDWQWPNLKGRLQLCKNKSFFPLNALKANVG